MTYDKLVIRLDQIHPLTDFVRNAKDHAAKIKATGNPEVLTINGRPELVVQDAASYEAMMEEVEKARIFNAILEGEADIAAGRTVAAAEALAQIRGSLGLES